MRRCAVIDIATGRVLNTVVADPENDAAPKGTRLEAIGNAPIDARFAQEDSGDFVYRVSASEVEDAALSEKGALDQAVDAMAEKLA